MGNDDEQQQDDDVDNKNWDEMQKKKLKKDGKATKEKMLGTSKIRYLHQEPNGA